jgi:hypothetical protein
MCHEGSCDFYCHRPRNVRGALGAPMQKGSVVSFLDKPAGVLSLISVLGGGQVCLEFPNSMRYGHVRLLTCCLRIGLTCEGSHCRAYCT